jgi:glutaredoxin 3
MAIELYATRSCPYCAELRDQLDGDGVDYVEYDVEADAAARARLWQLVGPSALVPVLVEDGSITQIGLAGRGCYVGSG